MTTIMTPKGNYVRVNGLDLYYESQGSGPPLVMLPGAFSTIAALGELVPQLATTRRVIAVELQGHGHTADIDRPLTYEALADDIAALITSLGLEQADLFGYSLGGGVALQTAIRHPAVVQKLALVSTAFKREGLHPEDQAVFNALSAEALAAVLAGTPLHQAYLQAAPVPEAWPTLVAKVRQLEASDYDWTKSVVVLTHPTLLLVGDADDLRLGHIVEFFDLLGGGKVDGDLAGLPRVSLAVLPATTHVGWAPPYHGIMTRTYLLPILTEFLDAPMAKICSPVQTIIS
jgi:pimeloyl-ACP methyl ester carboxylesterase